MDRFEVCPIKQRALDYGNLSYGLIVSGERMGLVNGLIRAVAGVESRPQGLGVRGQMCRGILNPLSIAATQGFIWIVYVG